MLILIVDDDPDDGFIFEEAIHEIDPDISCRFLSRPQEAITLLSGSMDIPPDFIFLDVNMPAMGGRECLMEIRKIEKLKAVPIIMFSTFISDKDEKSYKLLDAASLSKASNFSSLKTALRKVLFN